MYIDTQWLGDHLGWIIAFEAVAVFAYYYWDYLKFTKRHGSSYRIQPAKKSSANGASAPGMGAFRTIKPKK